MVSDIKSFLSWPKKLELPLASSLLVFFYNSKMSKKVDSNKLERASVT
jgi:hypothetical protein